MSADLGQLIPEFEPYARDLVAAAGAAGLQPRVTSTRRSYAEQKRLYDRFLAGAAQYPAAPPGTSAHEFGYAFDMIVSPMDALQDVAAVWLNAGGIWHASDPIHFEFPGFTVPQGFAQTPLGTEIRTLADWVGSLPLYLQIFIPMKWGLSQRLITYDKLQAMLADIGISL